MNNSLINSSHSFKKLKNFQNNFLKMLKLDFCFTKTTISRVLGMIGCTNFFKNNFKFVDYKIIKKYT